MSFDYKNVIRKERRVGRIDDDFVAEMRKIDIKMKGRRVFGEAHGE